MKTKTFNDLTTLELYNILQLRNEVFVVEQNCVYQDLDEKDKQAIHLFYEEDSIVIAYLRILPSGVSYQDSPSIGRVVVKDNARGRGLAKKIMEEAIDYIYNDLGESTIKISAQEYLTKFYQSLGFCINGESYLEDDIPHILMTHKKCK
ncbi:GNAT family N-acetyltransferase [Candidatus Izimaplasma bacterium ZiA1]|uniref:GNAT family N-acetyltransferase n=1 Tax=Candidatus Izimoplasma sp. ZiA1 TaxID=2024899 RepID=UPI000BAA905B|nr:GNAT family N-acetyltransferase [Candidatus Izimaplasma bacterium ZiA1]